MYDAGKESSKPRYPAGFNAFKFFLYALLILGGFVVMIGAAIWVWAVSIKLAPVILIIGLLIWFAIWADRNAPKDPPE